MQQYLDLVRDIYDNGDGHNDRTQVGTRSVFGRQIRFDLSEGFPLMTTKRLSFKIIAEELFWFLSGSTYNPHLQNRLDAGGKPIKIWDDWATADKCAKYGRREGDLGPVYGHTWRNFGATRMPGATQYYDTECRRIVNFGYSRDGHDQIRELCEQLTKNPRSRRLIVTGWDPREASRVDLPPCHTLFHFKWHEETNRLDCQLYQRSCDVFLGVPFNIASYALLTTLVAAAHGMVPGEFVHTFGDVHIYNTHLNAMEEQLSRTPGTLPVLNVQTGIGATSFDRLLDFRWEDLDLVGYNPQPAIKAAVAV